MGSAADRRCIGARWTGTARRVGVAVEERWTDMVSIGASVDEGWIGMAVDDPSIGALVDERSNADELWTDERLIGMPVDEPWLEAPIDGR